MPDSSIWFLLIGGALCVLGALAGIMSERRRLSFVIRDQAARNTEQGRRLNDTYNEMKQISEDNKHLSSFLVFLPDVVRNLNSQLSKRAIPPFLQSSLDQFFDPEQILVFTARAQGELVLAAGKGLPRDWSRGSSSPSATGRSV